MAFLVVDGLLPEGLADALDDAAVDLTFDDQRVDLVAAIVNRRIVDQADLPGGLVDFDDGDVAAEGEGEVHRVIGHLGLQVGFHPVGQVVSGKRPEGHPGERHFRARTALHRKHAV